MDGSLRRQIVIAFVALAFMPAIATGSGCNQQRALPVMLTSAAPSPIDALPSWNDGAVKRSVVDFVDRVTNDGPDFVPFEDRIAVFDNDGTLWQEKPLAEGAFTLARLERLTEADPSLRAEEPFKSALDADVVRLHEQGAAAVLELAKKTHTGMTDKAYAADVRQFLATARHPRFGVPYTDLAYTPMLELLDLLRHRGFTTYVCSGGDTDFIRVFSTNVYGLPPERVIGSRFDKELVSIEGKTALLRTPKIESINDKDEKPVGVDRRLGKRPIFAAGNVGTGGDIAMLRYTRDRNGPSFALVIQHDDAEREAAYGEKDGATLDAARRHGFSVVSMKRDWKVVFGRR
ncbi:MAG TPA: HAD family hydrolase [Labilithrix sp.]|nr:HAD family hydrolase [Labilithrix sp.]